MRVFRLEIIFRSYISYFGVEVCLRKVGDDVFWFRMNGEIKEVILKCFVCVEFWVNNFKELM